MQYLIDWKCSMDKKKYIWSKKEQDLVLKTVAEAKAHLNMQSWVITNSFESGQVFGEQMPDGRAFITDAENSVTQEYEKISIIWKPAMLRDIRDTSYKDAKETVYHELIHGLTAELHEVALNRFVTHEDCRMAVERLTQRITKIVCALTTKKKSK